MDIATGLSGIRTAAELLKVLREGLKSDQIKSDQLAGRIGEIYDYIVESKDALVEAKDEIHELREKLRVLHDDREFRESLTFHAGVYKRKGKGGVEEVYCAPCYDSTGKRIRVIPDQNCYSCPVKHGFIGE